MPRELDIGWQHGTMIGGHRHHVQCNYCHRTMIGGITRFKKHLASKRGEIRGCEAVPKEVREMIKKHLATSKPRKSKERKLRGTKVGALVVQHSVDSNVELHASDLDLANAREEHTAVHDEVETNRHLSLGKRELFDAFSSVPHKDEQGLAPPRATDLGWSHGKMVDGDRQKIQCKYCHKIILGGGISRLKQHLAGERGNIAPCDSVPANVKAQIQQHLGLKVLTRLKKQKDPEGSRSSLQCSGKTCNDDFPSSTFIGDTSVKRKGEKGKHEYFHKSKRTKNYLPHSTLKQKLTSQESIDQADLAVAKFFYDVGVPFNAANSLYFQRMADAIAAAGPGYKMPSFHSLRGELLNKCVRAVTEICKELKKSWEVTGCTVMVDRWKDTTGRVMLNFFVYCPKEAMFLKSVDVSELENSFEGLVNLFDTIVQDVGPQNIVNFLTESLPYYNAAGKVLMDKYKTFFSSVCANHCIELMLKGLGEMDEMKCVMEKAKIVCRFIYNNEWVLNLLKKKTEGMDIIHPALTEFAMSFCTLQNIIFFKDSLCQMFTSDAWEQSSFSRQCVGNEVTKILLDPQFWISLMNIAKVSKPLIDVLRVLDSEDRPSMGYLYGALEKAKKEIILAFGNNESEFMPYLDVIEKVQDEFHCPLHAAAYYLNPSMYYTSNFSINNVIQKSLLNCIETLEHNLSAQDNITRHKAFYEDALGDFSRPVAIRGRESLPPATWWSLYASDYPDLQHFAVRILSQACSITTSRKTWTMNESRISTQNRLERERINDLSFVHYNLHLQRRQMVAFGNKALIAGNYDPLCLDGMNNNAIDWIKDPEGHDRFYVGSLKCTQINNPILIGDESGNSGDDNTGGGARGTDEHNESDNSKYS